MMKVVFWIASKSKIFRNNRFNLQILQIGYSHLMKQGKNSCCLSGSEFTSLGLNLVTVLSRRCFSFLSNVSQNQRFETEPSLCCPARLAQRKPTPTTPAHAFLRNKKERIFGAGFGIA